jgi:MraZ protein
MLLGSHDHSLDDKNRLTLPAKFREELGTEVVVTHGMDGCLYAYSSQDFARLAERMGSLDSLSRESRMLQRHFFAGAVRAELDRQGRMVIPQKLLERAEIRREVTIAGVFDHLEIWDRGRWTEHSHEVEGSAEHVAERVANRD